MKPDLALNLTPQGIALLARAAGGGWVDVGEVALDDPALGSALAGLRARAVELAGPGFVTKIIIPNSQILYTRLRVSGRGKAEREAQIRVGLEGLTPYAVDDLAFDWSGRGAEVSLAVVARETLTEAEDFAKQHDFRPAAFVAVPEPGHFEGEPFFGQGSAAGQFLPAGARVEADAQAVRIVPGAAPLPPGAARDQSASAPAPKPAKVARKSTRRKSPAGSVAKPVAKSATGRKKSAEQKTRPAASAKAGPASPLPLPAKKAKKAVPASASSAPPPAFQSRRVSPTPANAASSANRHDPSATRHLAPVALNPEALGDTLSARAPRLTLSPVTSPTTARGKPDLSTDAADMARAVAAASPGAAPATDTSGLGRLAMSEPPQPTLRPGLVVTVALLVALAAVAIWASLALSNTSLARWLGFASPEPTRQITAPQAPAPDQLHSVLRVAPQPPVPPTASPSQATAPARATAREAILAPAHKPAPRFVGQPARDRAPTLVTRPNKPRATPVPNTAAGTSGSANGTSEALAAPAGASASGAAPGAAGAGPTPSPTTRSASTNPAESRAKPAVRKPLTHPEAAVDTVVAGIEQHAPGATGVPAQDRLSDLVLASIDPAVSGQGAVALPDASAVMPSPLPRAQGVPPGPGTRYVIDRRGMVVATPEGAITPDGIIVRSGRPPVAPPPRGTVPQAGVSSAAPPRPRPRPANLALKNGRLQLAPTPAAGTASSPSLSGSALAVNTSPVPGRRPAKFATIVAEARKAAAAPAVVPQSTTRRGAAVSPTRASVAKRATLRNSLSLGRLSLIGVYGSPSNRRALVRLVSGRYVKLKVGDNFNGGRVAGIGSASLSYIKGGRTYTLKMPRNG